MISSKTRDAEEGRKRGRPRGFDDDAVLEAAMLTFWRRGYRGTSLDDIVAATGAPRASLYRIFGDKKALLIAALGRYGAQFDARVAQAMAAEPNGGAAMAALLNASADRLASDTTPEGCLRCNSTLELAGADPEIDAALDTANAAYAAAVGRVVDRAVRAGELTAAEADGLPIYLTAIVNGLVTLARSGATREELRGVVERALAGWDRA